VDDEAANRARHLHRNARCLASQNAHSSDRADNSLRSTLEAVRNRPHPPMLPSTTRSRLARRLSTAQIPHSSRCISAATGCPPCASDFERRAVLDRETDSTSCTRPVAQAGQGVMFSRARQLIAQAGMPTLRSAGGRRHRGPMCEIAGIHRSRPPWLVRLDASELDHLAPLLGFLGDQPAEILWRARHHCCAEVGKPRLQLGIGEARIDLAVE
jgi:hypothetical protein